MKFRLTVASMILACSANAEDIARFEVPMQHQGASTFYVPSTIEGSEECLMLVDTGSGHSVINEATLKTLKRNGNASFVKNLQGVMADGSTKIVPLYRISAITIGDSCMIRDVEAAVLPNNARQILGISTLQRAAPFGFSFDPPTLSLTGCEKPPMLEAAASDNMVKPASEDLTGEPRPEADITTEESDPALKVTTAS